MKRNEAFELLEGHFGPDAYLNVQKNFKRHGHIGKWETTWYVYSNIPKPMFWERETLREAVAAALANVPKCRKEGE